MLLLFDPLALLQSAPQSSHPFDAENVQAVSSIREILRTFLFIKTYSHILYYVHWVRERNSKITESKKTEASSSCHLTSYVICLPQRTSANIFQRASKIAFALTNNNCFGATQVIIFTLSIFFVPTLKNGSIDCFFFITSTLNRHFSSASCVTYGAAPKKKWPPVPKFPTANLLWQQNSGSSTPRYTP